MCAVMSYSGSLSRKKLYSARSKDRKNGNRKKDNPQPADPLREATPEKHSMRKRFDIIEYCSSCGGESGHRFEESIGNGINASTKIERQHPENRKE